MSPERTSVNDDHFAIGALSRYHFATHHHSVDCRDFPPAYDRTVLATKPLNWAVKPWHYVHHTQTITIPIFTTAVPVFAA
jgi:hypothetical protein